jgi:hypothetical protein
MIGHYFVIFTSVPVGHKSHARLLTRLRTQTYSLLKPHTHETHMHAVGAEMRQGEMGACEYVPKNCVSKPKVARKYFMLHKSTRNYAETVSNCLTKKRSHIRTESCASCMLKTCLRNNFINRNFGKILKRQSTNLAK